MKRFDDYSEVNECTNCEHWWTNACDAPPIGSERPCSGFKASRRVSIPEDIKALQRALKRQRRWLSALTGAVVGILVGGLLFG